jgi:Lipocalin-like domain
MLNLVGAWRLKSAYFQAQDSGDRLDLFGPDPYGRAVFDPDGHMVVLITAAERRPAASPSEMAELVRSMAAYSGRWSLEGDKLTTEVDGAWDPGWVGTQQVRYCTYDGQTMSARTMPIEHPAFPGQKVIGYLDWQREA